MEVEGGLPPMEGASGREADPVQRKKRSREQEVFQEAVGSGGETRLQKRALSAIRRAPSAPLTKGEQGFCRRFIGALHEGNGEELERLASAPQMSNPVALHLLQAREIEGAGVSVLQRLVAAAGGDPCKVAIFSEVGGGLSGHVRGSHFDGPRRDSKRVGSGDNKLRRSAGWLGCGTSSFRGAAGTSSA